MLKVKNCISSVKYNMKGSVETRKKKTLIATELSFGIKKCTTMKPNPALYMKKNVGWLF